MARIPEAVFPLVTVILQWKDGTVTLTDVPNGKGLDTLEMQAEIMKENAGRGIIGGVVLQGPVTLVPDEPKPSLN